MALALPLMTGFRKFLKPARRPYGWCHRRNPDHFESKCHANYCLQSAAL